MTKCINIHQTSFRQCEAQEGHRKESSGWPGAHISGRTPPATWQPPGGSLQHPKTTSRQSATPSTMSCSALRTPYKLDVLFIMHRSFRSQTMCPVPSDRDASEDVCALHPQKSTGSQTPAAAKFPALSVSDERHALCRNSGKGKYRDNLKVCCSSPANALTRPEGGQSISVHIS